MPSPSSQPFAAPVCRLDTGFRYHCIYLPPEIADTYVDAGIRRVVATLNERPYRRAIQSNADGQHFVIVGTSILRDIKVQLDDVVVVELAPDPDPDRIDLGEEFTEVLEMDDEAAERFFSFTPGKQRSLAHYVTSAKREETRIKRALELAHKIKTYTLYGDTREE